jgi:hypothetical protein
MTDATKSQGQILSEAPAALAAAQAGAPERGKPVRSDVPPTDVRGFVAGVEQGFAAGIEAAARAAQTAYAEARDSEWDDGFNDARTIIANVIRALRLPAPAGEPTPIRWQRVNDESFEYAIQQGPHGDEFVKLLNGTCLRRPIEPAGPPSEVLLSGVHPSYRK